MILLRKIKKKIDINSLNIFQIERNCCVFHCFIGFGIGISNDEISAKSEIRSMEFSALVRPQSRHSSIIIDFHTHTWNSNCPIIIRMVNWFVMWWNNNYGGFFLTSVLGRFWSTLTSHATKHNRNLCEDLIEIHSCTVVT